MHRPSQSSRQRRGMALPVAIFAIVVIGALLAGAYFSSTQERRIGRNTLVEQRSFNVAEYGLNYDVSNWDQTRNLESNFPVGKTDKNPRYVNLIGDTAWVTVTRLTPTNFLVVSSGRANIDQATSQSFRRTSMMVQIAYPSVTLKGAVVSGGTVKLGGSGAVVGYDHNPSNWDEANDCSSYPDGQNLPAIAVGSKSQLVMKASDSTYNDNTANNANGAYAPADQGILKVTSVASDPNTYITYGSESWETLKSNADIKLPGNWSGTVAPVLKADGSLKCDRSVQGNWGQADHTSPTTNPFKDCISYYPIIYVDGNLSLGNAKGQGILMVNGDLTINAGFEFNGLVIVKNDLKKGNGHAEIRGGLMVANANIDCATGPNCVDGLDITGTMTVSYSKCAVENALRASAILVPVKQRSWAELY
jgi:hypothetical protein